MDKLIRIIIMLICGIAIPYIANIIYEPLQNKEELKELSMLGIIAFILSPILSYYKYFEDEELDNI